MLKPTKVLQLRPRRQAPDELSSQVAITVRTHLSLMQGYADIMEGLSPELTRQILGVMAEKTRELGSALQRFVEQAPTARPAIDDYRRVRERTRQLMTEHRQLLGRLQVRVSEAHDHVNGAGGTLS
ncbi:MAG: hypothetical protein M3Z28_04155 [Candidatus Dormibacteraeota bacterium]|nr:hypothetical protein [Candidatus Dormibacteraeota bacterium]